jgi:hypothetical protein
MAMLIIIVYDKDHKQVDYVDDWKLGMHPFNRVVGLQGSSLHVIANGAERDWILQNIEGIRKAPKSERHNTRWIGEDATFIVNHLPHPDDLPGIQ